jgi:hypothetical protein
MSRPPNSLSNHTAGGVDVSAAFRCSVREFETLDYNAVLGRLISAQADQGFAVHRLTQTETWEVQLKILGRAFAKLLRLRPESQNWSCLLEFDIPRRGKRPDVVLLADELIFVLEFKVGATSFGGSARWQAKSYCLDLADFHAASTGRRIMPILVATGAPETIADEPGERNSPVTAVCCVGGASGVAIADALDRLYVAHHSTSVAPINADAWETAVYRPSPTIVEAAERLFAGHTVIDISHAFSSNLTTTSADLLGAIESAQKSKQRTICFVTGIPGAGKTLAGLNAVHDPSIRSNARPSAVFLSGNGPLVKIVRAALVRDQQRQGRSALEATRTVSTFIDNVHRFITTYGIKQPTQPPHENAIVFDEAQRAWDAAAVYKAHQIERSEPDLILDIMERATEWSAVIALVGGGQEIHRGEAGLAEWGRALNRRTQAWRVLASPAAIEGGQSVAGQKLFEVPPSKQLSIETIPSLHLDVSVRSPRAMRMADWVNAVLTGRGNQKTDSSAADFPIVLTRDFSEAREWLRANADGEQRAGLLASSGALRLRAHGIEVSAPFRGGYPYDDWFLGDRSDTRSSHWLEVAATEFECQGLELDWTGVCWGGDFLFSPGVGRWLCRRFRGTTWQTVRKPADVQYTINKYRVLLTRARKGIVIFVPQGNTTDATRDPTLFDATADFLNSCGIPSVA